MWSGDYWASNKGSINYRWNSPSPTGFNLRSPKKTEAMQMEPAELMALAPSEKFDLLNGNYHYPLKNKVKGIAHQSAKEWEGICHGWAPAAMNHNEPVAKVLNNPDGIKIPFGSSDIKALISYDYAREYRVGSIHQMGSRCYRSRWRNGGCRNDMNAGAFHIVLTNKIGLEGTSFLSDMAHGPEVWNRPLYAYSSTVLADNLSPSESSAPGTKNMIKLLTILTSLLESDQNSWGPVIGTDLQLYEDVELEYTLDINHKGSIVGGEWLTAKRPDFLWTMSAVTEFKNDFKRLPELLNDWSVGPKNPSSAPPPPVEDIRPLKTHHGRQTN